MNKDLVMIKLQLISAQAASLAADIANNKLWEGDLSNKLGEISSTINELHQATRDVR